MQGYLAAFVLICCWSTVTVAGQCVRCARTIVMNSSDTVNTNNPACVKEVDPSVLCISMLKIQFNNGNASVIHGNLPQDMLVLTNGNKMISNTTTIWFSKNGVTQELQSICVGPAGCVEDVTNTYDAMKKWKYAEVQARLRNQLYAEGNATELTCANNRGQAINCPNGFCQLINKGGNNIERKCISQGVVPNQLGLIIGSNAFEEPDATPVFTYGCNTPMCNGFAVGEEVRQSIIETGLLGATTLPPQPLSTTTPSMNASTSKPSFNMTTNAVTNAGSTTSTPAPMVTTSNGNPSSTTAASGTTTTMGGASSTTPTTGTTNASSSSSTTAPTGTTTTAMGSASSTTPTTGTTNASSSSSTTAPTGTTTTAMGSASSTTPTTGTTNASSSSSTTAASGTTTTAMGGASSTTPTTGTTIAGSSSSTTAASGTTTTAMGGASSTTPTTGTTIAGSSSPATTVSATTAKAPETTTGRNASASTIPAKNAATTQKTASAVQWILLLSSIVFLQL